jgi:F0F1-type ATP synthase membrane subunit b/b'
MLFDIDGTFFIHLVFFLTLMIVLNKVLFQPFLELQDRRHEATRGRVEASRARLDKVRDREVLLLQELQEYRAAQAVLRQDARARCLQEGDLMRREADQAAELALAESEKQLQFEAEKVKSQLATRVPAYMSGFRDKLFRNDA